MSMRLKIVVISLSVLMLLAATFLVYVIYTVIRDAADMTQRSDIQRVLASESPVYYDDGITPVGVFFDKTHRKHIKYDQIPEVFVNALVAAEDKNFFRHSGVDFRAILRALLANIRAGRVVQGGSTLTQQTAKNVFRRERRSFKAKMKELVQALLLERRYSKEEILEMYVNQFFVTGYGKGLQIASQYFFDKDGEDLDLVEAAFIAGCIKAPNRYNPFIKKTADEKEKARTLAKLRKDYVLDRMLELGDIRADRHAAARAREIPFKHGRITYRPNVMLDYVREQLDSDFFRSVLREQGVQNAAVSGIGIYTSMNRDIQQAALKSLRNHLPLLDVALGGYPTGKSDLHAEQLGKGPGRTAGDLPFLARITEIVTEGKDDCIRVAWEGGTGVIPYEGFEDMGQAWLRWETGRRGGFNRRNADRFLRTFQVGDHVPVWLQDPVSTSGEDRVLALRLSSIPELEGGIVVVQNGAIKAMVGGYFNHFFNRAVEAKRQLGSIFKPLVYTAALQLKWNCLDPLQNVREIFPFENTYYLPHPDHPPQSRKVSMVFAGAKSENLATVWLMYRLTEHLNMSDFLRLTRLLGLAPREDEDDDAYRRRIRDENGVVVDRMALMQAAFEEAKQEAESDIIFAGEEVMLKPLRRLHFRLDPRWIESEAEEAGDVLLYNFERIWASKLAMEGRLQKARSLLRGYDTVNAAHREEIRACLSHFYRTSGKGTGTRLCHSESTEWRPEGHTLPVPPEEFITGATVLKPEDIWIDGRFLVHALETLSKATERKYQKLRTLRPYEPECLYRIRDFRTLVGLTYVARLSKHLGICTDRDPVLSFPLGPNAISILEAALAYQSILTGRTHDLASGEHDVPLVPIITRILDREGELIWEYRPEPQPVLSERVSASVGEILRQVMELGTGRTARDEVRILGMPIPTYGKTGTADRFTNSSFVGHVPGPNPGTGALDVREGYTIAAYVGYDDNRPMKTDHIAVYGATGALPLWAETADAIVNSDDYIKQLQLADLAFDGSEVTSFPILEEFARVPVSPITGLPVHPPAAQSGDDFPRIAADGILQDGKWHGNRVFEPLKRVSEWKDGSRSR